MLKLHRLDLFRSNPAIVAALTLSRQTRPYIVPRDQDEARLHGQAQVRILDVHVSARCRERVRLHEGTSDIYASRTLPRACVSDLIALQVLHEYNFPVPRPIDQARHCILMEFIDAYPL